MILVSLHFELFQFSRGPVSWGYRAREVPCVSAYHLQTISKPAPNQLQMERIASTYSQAHFIPRTNQLQTKPEVQFGAHLQMIRVCDKKVEL